MHCALRDVLKKYRGKHEDSTRGVDGCHRTSGIGGKTGAGPKHRLAEQAD
jgi:hypothetical protein